jgi:2-polyprenyl-6-methoxyphenol hydroxylase-like FAD-dependent oxidoreductase
MEHMAAEQVTTGCCIAGGGPAGIMLGFLLARAGIEVLVLEKHADFLRDFRGDTIHPSTLELMYELGLLDKFLARPHQKVDRLTGYIGDSPVTIADFRHLPTHCRFIAFMPQWDFLDFMVGAASRYPAFRLRMQTEAMDLVTAGDRICGLRASGPQGALDIRAPLVVGADGRHSTVRARAGLAVEDIGAPMDVLWMRLSRRSDDPGETLGRIGAGQMFVMINRGDYWQCAMIIPKGSFGDLRLQGIEAFRAMVAAAAPVLRDRVGELRSWDDVKLLTVAVDRLRQWWRPGLLCIGDAAHAMSPVGGVGINLAIQDAVAAANILAAPLRAGVPAPEHLRAVQRRREWPTRVTQRLQIVIQNNVIRRVLASRTKPKPPLPVRILNACPHLQRIPARLIGIGVRPEHVRTPEAPGPSRSA